MHCLILQCLGYHRCCEHPCCRYTMVVISEPGFLVSAGAVKLWKSRLLNSFQVVTWTFFAIGTVLTVLRLYVRQTKLRGLGWDDLLHCMAWTVLLGLVALETSVNHLIFKVSNVTSGRTSLTASFLEDEVPHYIVVQLAIMLLTWTTTWAVKASFLLFYRGLLRNTGRYMIAWWLVTIFTGLAYISVFFPIIFTCGSPADYFSIGKLGAICLHSSLNLPSDACLSPHSIERTKGNVGYTTAVDITTDLMSRSSGPERAPRLTLGSNDLTPAHVMGPSCHATAEAHISRNILPSVHHHHHRHGSAY